MDVLNARFLVVLYHALLSHCVTVYEHTDRPVISKSKVELQPLFVSSRLYDMVSITAPIVNTKDAVYYLTRPNGETKKIYIKQPNYTTIDTDYNDNEIAVKHIKEDPKAIIRPYRTYEIFKFNTGYNYTSLEERVDSTHINIGPLTEEDHGNWVISVYYKDLDDNWIELFQVVTIKITETVPSIPSIPILKTGAVFEPSFAYSIKGLETCELIAPASTFDRFYKRSRIDMDRCGYIIDNITKADEGVWTIIGVGKIVYETQIDLKVLNKVT